MRDDPRNNLKWLEQQLLEEERTQSFSAETHDPVNRVELLPEDLRDPEPPVFVRKTAGKTRGQQAEQAHIKKQFDESAAVIPKTKKQRKKEAKQQKIAGKQAAVNRNIKGLVILAVLEIIGILCILGWWLQ